MTRTRYSAWTIYRRLLTQARPYWPHLAVVFALNLLSTPLHLLMPLPIKLAVDHVVGDQPLPAWADPLLPEVGSTALLIATAVLLVLVTLLTYLNSLAIWLMHSYTGQRLVLAFRSRLFRHVQRLSLVYHDTRGTSDSTYRIQYDAPAIQWIPIDGIMPFVASILTLVGMVVVIARMDWQLALVAMAVCPVLLLLTRMWGARLRRQWEKAKDLESSAMGVVQETLGSLRVVKAFGQEQREHQRFVDTATRGMWSQLGVSVSQGTFDLMIGVTLAGGSAAALILGVMHVQQGKLTLGELWMIWAYLAQLYGPLQTMSKKIGTLQNSVASAGRAFSLLDEAPDVVEKPNARPIDRARGDIDFEQVAFEYCPGEPVLQDVSFHVDPGTRVGILGHTGAGKSTLLNLLMRFYDPTAGTVRLDGVDLRDYALEDLRRQFSVVLQEPVLFSASIAENIAYARPDATQEQIIAAARAASAHEFIERLPDGYDTLVGERGMTLSGGERQRVSLARAFLKDAPILVLDEPTSAIDTQTELAIMAAMHRLMEGRTTFMIAHRLSTLRQCDLLLLLDHGRLIEATTDVAGTLAALEAEGLTPDDAAAALRRGATAGPARAETSA